MPQNRLALFAAMMLSACAALPRLETSSREVLSPSDSTLIVPLPLDAAETSLVSLFSAAHFQITHHVTLEGGRTLIFTGVRRVLDRSYTYKGIRHYVPEEIGSTFYVTIEPTAEGSQIWLYGKPVVDHDVTCSTFDHEYDVFSCDGVNLVRHSGIFASGREEGDVIRWVVTALAHQNPSARAARPDEIAVRHAED